MIDIGIVYYKMRQDDGEIDAVWYTTRHQGTKPGTGLAIGDTSSGFPGEYEITYFYPDGHVSAVLDLTIEKNGDIYNLTYSKDGEALLIGVGVETQDGLAAGYRMVEQQ